MCVCVSVSGVVIVCVADFKASNNIKTTLKLIIYVTGSHAISFSVYSGPFFVNS